MQEVRQLLVAGPVSIGGQDYASLLEYYVAMSKMVLAGHNCNNTAEDVAKFIQSAGLLTDHQLLNMPLALACDAVHYALVDFTTKYLKPSMQACPQLTAAAVQDNAWQIAGRICVDCVC
jgi:hypothetical protein